jgi:hypothetical protein
VEVLALASSGSGKHRADVEISVLESFEIRSRRSIREAEKAKQAKFTRRARQAMDKSEAKANKKQRELKQPLRATTPGGRLRANQGFRTALTMLTWQCNCSKNTNKNKIKLKTTLKKNDV